MNPSKFFKEVKQEVGKITWPTRQETTVTTGVVLVVVAIASIFFLIVDWVLFKGIQTILGL
jgi:preprotein translocase subunit SecE